MIRAIYTTLAVPALFMVAMISAAPAQEGAAEVKVAGEMRRVMHEGDLSRTIALDSLAGRPHIYALGPLEGLMGEVTVWDGFASIATVEDGAIAVSTAFEGGAPFLVYAQVPDWQSVEIPAGLEDGEELEAFIRRAAADAGVDITRPFPFLITGMPELVKFHIVNKEDDLPHSPEEHDRIKIPFELREKNVEIIGFYSEHHHGVFTHHDSNIHMHFRTSDNSVSGHVDELQLRPRMLLFIPEL